jgi:hypothetical protein
MHDDLAPGAPAETLSRSAQSLGSPQRHSRRSLRSRRRSLFSPTPMPGTKRGALVPTPCSRLRQRRARPSGAFRSPMAPMSSRPSVRCGSRGCASAARPDGRRDPDAPSGERRALEELGARVVRGAGQVLAPVRVAQQIIDGIRDEPFLITARPEVITSSSARPATTNADWRGCDGFKNKRTLLTPGASPARRRSPGSRGRARGPRGASAPRARTPSARCHDRSSSASPCRLGETRGGRPAR